MTAPTIVNTRSAQRLAVLNQVAQEAEPLLQTVDAPGLEGAKFLSAGTLAEALERVKASPLPAIDAETAEVKTPATVYVAAICPQCDLPTKIAVAMEAELVTDRFGATIKVKAKAKGHTHVHGQLELEVADDQEELGLDADDVVADDDEDLRPTGEVNTEALQGAARNDVEAAARRPVRLRSVPGKVSPADLDQDDDALLPS